MDAKGGSSTPLHAVTDWPGFFPHGPAIVAVLIEAGADPNAQVEGSWHAETPLHWAASSDDVEVARSLIDGGADIEATGASIAGGTPLDDAVGYGCWQVARLLVERGARVERLWHAAALGMFPARSTSSWPPHRQRRSSSPTPSGRRATAANGGWPSTCCPRRRLERQPVLERQHTPRCCRLAGHRAPGARNLAARLGRQEATETR